MARHRALGIAAAALLALTACPGSRSRGPTSQPAADAGVKRDGPPAARRGDVVDVIHGVRVADPYRWLEDARSPETRRWLAAYRRYTARHLARLPGRARLRRRLARLSYVASRSAPRRYGRRYFYSRRAADEEKAVWYWRQGRKGRERVLIDPNKLSADGSVSLRGISIAWNGAKVAYKLSRNAADEATLHVLDVKSGKVSKVDVIPGAKYAHPSWTPSGRGFYYTRLPTDPAIPSAERPGHAAVYFHRLGTDPRRDRLVRRKTSDPRKFLHAQLSRDGRYLLLYIYFGWTRADVYFKDLRRHRRWRRLAVGLDALHSCLVWRHRFYLLTNDRAPNYRLYRIDPRKLDRREWLEIVPEERDAVLEDVRVVGGRLALRYLSRATTVLKLATLRGRVLRTIAFPELGTASNLVGHPRDDRAYFSFRSFTRPKTIYGTSVRRGGRKTFFERDLPIDPAPYRVRQVFYKSRDGTPISMFLVHRRQLRRDGTTPFLLSGYGGFNVNITPSFSPAHFVWLEAGGGLAIPNLRGGGEYGETWHRAGMLTRKQNVFDDFIAAAEHLIAKRYTSSARLAISGRSNGGLLVGAAMTQRPRLFRAVLCGVPLLDMVRYHRFGSGRTWISEYGSAENGDQFRALYAYSPYHRVRPRTPYPALLVLSADSDDRVDPLHARKFVAAVSAATSSGRPVLLRVERRAGHGGGDMIDKRVAREADELAFLLHQLGVRQPAAASAPSSAPARRPR